MDQLEENYERGDTITGAATGYDDLDELLSGLQKSTLNIVGARPAMGKCVAWFTPMVDLETGDRVTGAGNHGTIDRARPPAGAVARRPRRSSSTVASIDVPRRRRQAGVHTDHPVGSACDGHRGSPVPDRARMAATPARSASATTWRFRASSPVSAPTTCPGAEIDILALDTRRRLRRRGAHVTDDHQRARRGSSGRRGRPPRRWASGLVHTRRGGRRHDVAILDRSSRRPCQPGHRDVAAAWIVACRRAREASARRGVPAARGVAVPLPAAGLFATDGTAWIAAAGYGRIGYASVSKQLIDDVAHLVPPLWYPGQGARGAPSPIGARCAPRTNSRSWMRRRSCGSPTRSASSARRRPCRSLRAWALNIVRHEQSPDLVPAAVWDDIIKAKGDLSWAEVNRRLGRPASNNWHASRRGRLQPVDRGGPRRGARRRAAPALGLTRRGVGARSCRSNRPVLSEVIDFTVPGLAQLRRRRLLPAQHRVRVGHGDPHRQARGKPVLVFSLEMGHSELTQRILSSEAKVDSTKLRTGKLSESDWSKIGLAVGRLEVPLFLDDNPQVTVMEIRAKARRIKAQHGGLALIMIDYLQLMSGNGTSENRQLEVSEISRNLKVLARELEVPIVALSQLSRNLESRADKRPMLADLRESGSLEQDADVVMFLYRDEVYNPESPDKGSAEVIVAKHRSGPIGTKRLVFLGQYTRFDNAARSM